LASSCDSFINLNGIPLPTAQTLIDSQKVSILIEMNGYTQHGRPELVAGSNAPVRVSFLGFANSLMGDFIDLITTGESRLTCFCFIDLITTGESRLFRDW
jgi:protein O-GlcNAc transferase